MKIFFSTPYLSLASICLMMMVSITAATTDNKQQSSYYTQRLRGVAGSALRRILVGSSECFPHEMWEEARGLITGSMWETIVASQELFGVAVQTNGQLSHLSLEWIPSMNTILDPTAGKALMSTLASNGVLFCSDDDNQAFALYAESCSAWSGHIAPLITMMENWKSKASTVTVSELPGEKNALKRFIIAEADYHCERHLFFQKYLPSIADSKKSDLFSKRDALFELQALLPGSGADTNTAMTCFEQFNYN